MGRLDEILIAITKSQGQKFHELMQQISQMPSSWYLNNFNDFSFQ
jgi:hypothetical protein